MTSPAATTPERLSRRSVALVTMGCARNEVDSEELAGRLDDAGFGLVLDPSDAEVVVVNTCGFVESAKQDSIDALIEAADLKGTGTTRAVVAVGCLAERYGNTLADALPEADAVLSFDDYTDIAARLDAVLAGRPQAAHAPRDRRTLLPLSPVERQGATRPTVPGHGVSGPAAAGPKGPGLVAKPDPSTVAGSDIDYLPPGIAPASGPRPMRRRLDTGPVAPLKLASGCDRRCTFCAIPAFRGAFLSRQPDEVFYEARWLADQGVRELFLVSENSTSYGKDLGDLRALEALLPRLAAIDGVDRVRVSYLQPAEMRPSLVEAMVSTPGVAPYFDLSFQHASGPLLRRMRRFGDADRFLELLDSIRVRAPEAGVRSNVIVGFPGESESDLAELTRFLVGARLDVVGVFGYSDEDGTEAATYDDKVPAEEIAARVALLTDLVEQLTAERAEERIGQRVDVLIEASASDEPGYLEGRAAHQGPEVDGSTLVRGSACPLGTIVTAVVARANGVDLVAEPLPQIGADNSSPSQSSPFRLRSEPSPPGPTVASLTAAGPTAAGPTR